MFLKQHGFGTMFGVPNLVVDQYLKLATPAQLRVLLYILRNCGREVPNQEIAEKLNLSEDVVEEVLQFWMQTELFGQGESVQEPVTPVQEPVQAPKTDVRKVGLQDSRHADLNPLEIERALKDSQELKDLCQMVEQIMGNLLRHVELKALVWMHDYNHIDASIIVMALEYAKKIGKCSVSYAETIILNWWDNGIQTYDQVCQEIDRLDKRNSFTGQIMKHFELAKKPTPKQQSIIDSWQDRNIPMELILYAYEKSVDNTGNSAKTAFSYIDKILTSWNDAGYKTRADVDTYDKPMPKEQKQMKKQNPKSAPVISDNAQAYESFVFNLGEEKK